MSVGIVTGSGGLVGAESVRWLVREGLDVIGIENDMRSRLFGSEASTRPTSDRLLAEFPNLRVVDLDIRDADGLMKVFAEHSGRIEAIVHAASQPSHDWAAADPQTDFTVNANGTLNLLEAARSHAPDAPFIFVSTNKVYGDRPNELPFEELPTRFELPSSHRYFGGIDTSMPIDASLHSLFGVSKTSADLLVQEYGRYFGIPTVSFRGGCLTGPHHAGAEPHGFLAYLMRCVATGTPYTVYGYDGKQVRDNLHCADLVAAFAAYRAAPRPAAIYNIGGGRYSNCSMLEAIETCERVAGRELDWQLAESPRIGDHLWWISDLSEFRADYPEWEPRLGVEDILREMHDSNRERWAAARR